MKIDIKNVKDDIKIFSKKHSVDVKFYCHSVEELRSGLPGQDNRWSLFEKNAGVYCFFDRSDEAGVKYIGMSHRNTGGRVFGWLFKDNKVNKNIDDEDTILHIVLNHEEFYMASAIEAYLIEKIKPKLNVTGAREYDNTRV